ncbi:hypothetical protein BHM03_00033540, partial [Ensete ventricosum]
QSWVSEYRWPAQNSSPHRHRKPVRPTLFRQLEHRLTRRTGGSASLLAVDSRERVAATVAFPKLSGVSGTGSSGGGFRQTEGGGGGGEGEGEEEEEEGLRISALSLSSSPTNGKLSGGIRAY